MKKEGIKRHWGLELKGDLHPERASISKEARTWTEGEELCENRQIEGEKTQLVPRSGHGRTDFSSCDLITEFVLSAYLFSFPNEAQSSQVLKELHQQIDVCIARCSF